MGNLVQYRLENSIARITMDDGKVNVMSPAMIGEVRAALDRAESDGAVVVLGGRPGIFSAGFDLAVLRAGGDDALGMLRGGFELAERVLSFPRPVVMACTGHAVAMGVFLLLSGDYRLGARGSFKFQANEVAIGLTVPLPAIEILRMRLTPSCFSRAVGLAEPFSADNAVEAGFLDRMVDAEELDEVAEQMATTLLALNENAHTESKARAREKSLVAIREGTIADFGVAEG